MVARVEYILFLHCCDNAAVFRDHERYRYKSYRICVAMDIETVETVVLARFFSH